MADGAVMDRDEHLTWCKERALEYWRDGDLGNAVASMTSDLGKHDETQGYNSFIMALGIIYVASGDYDGVKRWIEGFR
jgi:hypothetical protein